MASDLQIRKAFEAPLKAAIEAEYGSGKADPTQPGCMVSWPGMTFDDSRVDLYVRPRMSDIIRTPRTLGDADETTEGIFKIGCFLKAGLRQDPLDLLVDTVKAPYPWSADLSAGGAKIQIERLTTRGVDGLAGWIYRTHDIGWRINI